MDNGQELQHVADGPYYTVAKTPQANKRKSQDDGGDGGSQGRAKRNRYISIACNECKRRKIKCNGQSPCQRCGNLSLECIYAPNCCSGPGFKESPEYRDMIGHIQSLQQQVNDLYASLEALRNGQAYVPPSSNGQGGYPPPSNGQGSFPLHPDLGQSEPPASYRSPSQPHGSQPRFQGPTSSEFGFNVARASLQTMGITAPELHDDQGYNDDEIFPRGSPQQLRAPMAPMTIHPNKDPLWKIGKDEACRLCRVYEEEMGLMYPVLDLENTLSHANMLFTFTESAAKTGLINPYLSGPDRLGNSDVNILKMILATALIVEGKGESELGRELYESTREAFERRLLGDVDIKGLVLLVLVAEYHFQQDEENQAYRVIGVASRLCIEIGLHRRDTLLSTFPHEDERSWAIKLFWSIYVLDRRWSFGTGKPFALQDADIDPHLPEPDNSTPYLIAMISYSRISSKVWRSTTSFEGPGNEITKENIDRLDSQISQWHNTIPVSLRFQSSDFNHLNHTNRGQRRLQVILYMRTNQMLVYIYRPVLHSATSIMENRQYAQKVVNVAKDSIRVLFRLNETTDIYSTQQVCFNYFLISALAVLFLAVSHAPVEFSQMVRDEFYMALDLVKGFSALSPVSERLWKTIKWLKEIGPKLGAVSRQQALTDPNDPHSSAAVAMAGLAGHQVDEIAAFPRFQDSNTAGSSPMNGQQMSRALKDLFDTAGGYGNNLFAPSDGQSRETANGFTASQGEMTSIAEKFSGFYGNDGEFSKIVGNLF